jgi:hypothetical protein
MASAEIVFGLARVAVGFEVGDQLSGRRVHLNRAFR